MTYKFSLIKSSLLIFLLLSSIVTSAHGSLSERISEKTLEIKEDPENSQLYFDRGFLYQQHEEYDKAITDFLKSKALGFDNNLINFRMAKCHYLNNNFKASLIAVKKYSIEAPNDVKGRKLYAQILKELGQYKSALSSYKFVVKNIIDLRPEDVIEYSEIVLLDSPQNYTEAINILDLGLEKIGANTITLQIKKLEYLKKSHQIELAIGQYNYFIESIKRKEFWYFKKAQYLFENERIDDAKIALQQSKLSIQILNTKFKNTEAIKTLTDQIIEFEKTLNNE